MGRDLKKPVDPKWVSEIIGREYCGSYGKITRIDSAAEAKAGSLCFIKNKSWARNLPQECIAIGSREDLDGVGKNLIFSDSPRLDFARLLAVLDAQVGFVWSNCKPQIHPTVRMGVNVVIGHGSKIGASTIIGNNVVIGPEVVIGERCNIKSCAVIGEDGFGFERDQGGTAVRLPHVGTVIIGSDVEIGSLTTVCRGTLANTVISNGVKIDDHVHIAHNVFIDEHVFVIACAELSGGVKVGKRAWIAPGASVLNQITVGDDAIVGLGAVVFRDVEAGGTVIGNPAKILVPRN
jgi:UDP-3-O-[3-hydroxymyristoyl] glucosamine N-acyltransferase